MSDIKKEFYTLDKGKPTIGLLMMVKNEEKRIHVTLESIVGYVDALIIFDTGSTDKTIEIIETFADKHKINLYLKQGTFVNFSISRNVSLDFADTIDVHYLLLLDCNDELRGGEILRKIAKDIINQPNNAFLVCQQWWCGQMDKYYNIRFVRARCNWRYKGSVHEWMSSDIDHPVVRFPDTIVLFQDRTQDDDKTGKRFKRDRDLLLADYKLDPKESRTLFYLAQTCQCLGLHDEALYYSKLRLELIGFIEERFHSYLRCGTSCLALGHEWGDCMKWFLKAYEEFQRVEPLVKIADYYRHKASALMKEKKPALNLWRTAYMYLSEACKLSYPNHCILFVDKGMYDYYRWHLMGIVAFYINKFEEGKEACNKAIAEGTNKDVNIKNLQFYLDEENNRTEKKTETHESETREIRETREAETREQFMTKTVASLRSQFPVLPQHKLIKRAVAMWKKSKKN